MGAFELKDSDSVIYLILVSSPLDREKQPTYRCVCVCGFGCCCFEKQPTYGCVREVVRCCFVVVGCGYSFILVVVWKNSGPTGVTGGV